MALERSRIDFRLKSYLSMPDDYKRDLSAF
nr:MAG TPA: hypothetical protein [Caudoviricetes sp.]